VFLFGEFLPSSPGKELGADMIYRSPSENGFAFINILIISVTLIVVAVPEGMLFIPHQLAVRVEHTLS